MPPPSIYVVGQNKRVIWNAWSPITILTLESLLTELQMHKLQSCTIDALSWFPFYKYHHLREDGKIFFKKITTDIFRKTSVIFKEQLYKSSAKPLKHKLTITF